MNAMKEEKKNNTSDEEKTSVSLNESPSADSQKNEESTAPIVKKEKPTLDPRSKKALIWSLVAITLVFSLMATFLAIGFKESRMDNGTEATHTGNLISGFFDGDGKKIEDGGSFEYAYVKGDAPTFNLNRATISSDQAKTIVLPYFYSSEESGNKSYYVLSTSDYSSTSNLFGHDVKEKQISSIYAERYYSTIGAYAFSGLSGLKSFAMGNTATSGATASFGAYAFSGNALLEKVSLPNILKSLGEGLFQGCGALASISYGGTTSDWAKVSQGNLWHDSTLKSVVCTDGTISL